MMEDNYIAPELAAEEKRFKYSLIWVEHRDLLRKIGLTIWGGVAGLMILYSLWVMVDTFLISYETERALLVNTGLNQSTRHNAVLASAPGALKLSSSSDIFAIDDDRYDFYTTVENENEDYWAEFDYYFSYGSSVTETKHGFVYPVEEKPLVYLAWESDSRPSSAQVILENIQWHMIDGHTIPDFVTYREDMIDFDITDGLKQIPIEERDSSEVTSITGLNSHNKLETVSIIPENAQVVNYAFDVTPAKFISKIITEKGIINPNKESISGLLK